MRISVDSIQAGDMEHCTEFQGLIGNSRALTLVKNQIRRIAPLNSSVLITGESGTGKEIVAQFIHQFSQRAKAPLICVNCAALPETLIESELFGYERGAFTGAATRRTGLVQHADRGSLFLDEIGDMSAGAQAKILRTLELNEIQPLGSARPIHVDVRVIAATHHDLDHLVAADKFRTDLYYRLDVLRIHVPPLRERLEDIPMLAAHFLKRFNEQNGRQVTGITSAGLERLMCHSWPGNVRELRNVIENAAAICSGEFISEYDFRSFRAFHTTGVSAVRRSGTVVPLKRLKLDRATVIQALEEARWNMTRTAELLKWSRSTLYRRMAYYRISRDGLQTTPGESLLSLEGMKMQRGSAG